MDSNICFVNYPQEIENWYKNHGKTYVKPAKKSNDEIIKEIYAGLWSNGEQHYDALTVTGYDYYTVQNEINRRIKSSAEMSKADIKVGSMVNVKSGAKTYNGGGLAFFVYNRVHVVSELFNDRAVICYENVVVAAVNIKDLDPA